MLWRKELTAARKIIFAHLAQQFEMRQVPEEELICRGRVAKLQEGIYLGLNPNLTSLCRFKAFTLCLLQAGILQNLVTKS